MALIACMYKKFEYLKYLIHEPSLVYEGSIGWKSLSKRSRKCLPLALNAWNIIFQIFEISLHLLFLSKSQDDLHENNGVRLKFFVSLSTMEWISYLSLLGQFQKSIEFERSLIKNSLSSFNIAIDWYW